MLRVTVQKSALLPALHTSLTSFLLNIQLILHVILYQDELIAVKLREAEANLSLKELRQRVTEISETWQRYLQVSRMILLCFSTPRHP